MQTIKIVSVYEKKVVSKVIDLTMNVAAFITNLSLRLVTIKKST